MKVFEMSRIMRCHLKWAAMILLLPASLFPLIQYLPGWPVSTFGSQTSPIYIADVDDDGSLELIYGDRSFGGQGDDWLYVKSFNGLDKPGWPKNASASDRPPALYD
jgi:hypothetical protein